MTLAYYNKKDDTFHEKWYQKKEDCKKDFSILKRAGVPFCYVRSGIGFHEVAEYGLEHGKPIDISKLPSLIANMFEGIIEEDNSHDYGGKRELLWYIYESEYWYSLAVDLGEDSFENEVVNEYFVTKDGKSLFSR